MGVFYIQTDICVLCHAVYIFGMGDRMLTSDVGKKLLPGLGSISCICYYLKKVYM